MVEMDVESHNMGPTFYWLTSLCSMSNGHPIPEIQLFQNFTLKIQGQGHGCGQSWKSQSGCNILSTHIPFVPCQSALPYLRYSIFKIWPWKSKVKVMGGVNVESHNMGPTDSNILPTHIPIVPCQSAIPILRYNFFKIWPWKSKVKVMGEVNVESHNIGPTFYWLTSLPSMSNGHPIPEIWLFQNFTLKIQGHGHGWGQSWKSHSRCIILLTQIPFVPCQSALPFLRYSIFKIWPWKSKVKIKWPWWCTTTGLDDSIELQMV